MLYNKIVRGGKESSLSKYRSVYMSKGFEQRKNLKKKPTMTLKEKRQKKHDKKISKDQHEPLVM